MLARFFIAGMLVTGLGFAQLPDRDELAAKFKTAETSHQAAEDLLEHFAMGGIRTLLRNLNDLDASSRLAYGNMFRNMDMFRFRDDLNSNLTSVADADSQAMYLMLISSAGRQIADTFFSPYVDDESSPVHVRLAAAGGIIKIQNPALYDRFLAIADNAVVDSSTGQNDLYYANLNKENLGFFLYAKGKADQKDAPHGAIICAIEMSENDDTDLYEALLNNKKKKYYASMIDHAILVGGTKLIDVMLGHKQMKKSLQQLESAKLIAEKFAEYRVKSANTLKGETATLLPYLPVRFGGTASKSGYHSAYAIAKIDATGQMSLVYHNAPFGDGNDNLKAVLTGRTMPANVDFAPVETYVLVAAP